MADVADTDVGTLGEGLTLTVAELAPYGGTLSEEATLVPPDSDSGTLASATTLTASVDATETGVLASATTLTAVATGTESGTLDDSGAVSATTVTVVAAEPVSVSSTLYLPANLRDFVWRMVEDEGTLGEQAMVERVIVQPFVPPDPYAWLAETADEDLVMMALVG